jgi:hypothetical protein
MSDEQVVDGATTEEQKAEPQQTQEEPLTLEAVKKMIQSETDRVRTEYSRKLKESEAEKEELQKERMTEKERAKFELEQEKRKNAETAAELARRELALERANIVSELAIPKDLAQFVNGKDRADILDNAKSLMTAVDKAVRDGINKKLATDSGPAPQSGDQTQPGTYDQAAWQKIWAMKPGAAKEEALTKAYESLAGIRFEQE